MWDHKIIQRLLIQEEWMRPHEIENFERRTYRVPPGYMDPKKVALEFGGMACLRWNKDALSNPDAPPYSWYIDMGDSMWENLWPVYWWEHELIDSLFSSHLPEDVMASIRLADIQWPVESCIMMLPKDIIFDDHGRSLSYLVIDTVGNEENRLIVIAGRNKLADEAVMVTYQQQSGLEVINDKLTYLEGYNGINCRTMPLNEPQFYCTAPEVSVRLKKDLIRLGMMLITIMTDYPELVDKGSALRSVKVKGITKNKLRATLYQPNFMKRTSGSSASSSQNGHVIPHFRRGHWRLQPFGPGRAKQKLIFIEKTLVAANDLEETA